MRGKFVAGKRDKWLILGLVFGLLVFGLIMIGDVSLVQAEVAFGDKFYFLKKQFFWALLGMISLVVFSKLDYHFLKKIARGFFLLTLILLALVFVPGLGLRIYGARRWLNLGFLTLQPVEIVKLSLALYFSSLLSNSEGKLPIIRVLLILLIPVAMVIFQPDFGSAILLVVMAGVLLLLNGKNLYQLGFLAILGIMAGGILAISSPYRKERVLGLLNPFYDPQGKSYHVYQLALTLGSGGWFGLGMGNSRQKYQYLPEATTDSIVALIAEEFGFVGIFIFISIFVLLIVVALKVANNCSDLFGRSLALGIIAWVAAQGALNLGAMAMVLPLTGVPFPFISYGGSSLVILLTGIGIFLNICSSENFKQGSVKLK